MLSNKERTVFISGSAYEYGRFGDTGKPFIRELTKQLLRNSFRIISGFGLGVGSAVVEGALSEAYRKTDASIDDYLKVYPFPGNRPPEETVSDNYRNEMIAQAGVAIFLFGNKLENISINKADGMIKEFDIARSHRALLIPVGASGYVAESLWLELMKNYDDYFDTREKYGLYEELGQPYTRHDRLIELILQIAQ